MTPIVTRRKFICAAVASASAAILAQAAPQTAPARRPNILFAIADDATWAHFGAYGCRFAKTPSFDRVAREGILFKNAFTTLPKCSPSRAALLTGRYPWQLAEACDHNGIFPATHKVYPDLLESAGYCVGFTGKGWAPGDWEKGGFHRNPAGPEYNELKKKPPTTGISNIDYAANFDAFLARRPQGAPFCFWYGGHEPHRGYELGSGRKSGKRPADVTVPPYLPDSEAVRSDILDYALEIEWFDTQLGRMIKKLEEIGELDNTLIVVTADNGMPFPRDKGHMFEDGCHMPLAIRWGSAVKGGRVVEDFVSFVDLAPTFVEAAGLTPLPEMAGRSLANILQSAAGGQVDPARDHVIMGRERCDLGRPEDVGYPVRVIRTKEFWYSHNFEPDRWPSGNPETGFPDVDASPTKRLVVQDEKQEGARYFKLAFAKRPAEELYDLQKDPACINNVADDPQYAAIKAQIWDRLQAALRQQQDPRILGQGSIFDRYPYVGGRAHAWKAKPGK